MLNALHTILNITLIFRYLQADLENYDLVDLKSVFDVILIDPPLEEYQRRCPGRTFNWKPWEWEEVSFYLLLQPGSTVRTVPKRRPLLIISSEIRAPFILPTKLSLLTALIILVMIMPIIVIIIKVIVMQIMNNQLFMLDI